MLKHQHCFHACVYKLKSNMYQVCVITFKFCCHARLSRYKNAKIYTTTRRNQRYDISVSRISFENHEHISERTP
jgi:hypothetical protein